MREKYIEERHPRWFSMCTHAIDITDVNEIAFAVASDERMAEIICARHNALLDAFIALAQAFDEADHRAFTTHWYGQHEEEK